MIPVEEAIDLVLQAVRPLPPVRVPFNDALGLVLAEDVHAAEPMPSFRAASVDGYAVIASDTAKIRKVVGDQAAGYVADVQVTPGTAVRVTTGAPVPPGADAMVMVESTEERDGYVQVKSSRYRSISYDRQNGSAGSSSATCRGYVNRGRVG
jgi:gephyrin